MGIEVLRCDGFYRVGAIRASLWGHRSIGAIIPRIAVSGTFLQHKVYCFGATWLGVIDFD